MGKRPFLSDLRYLALKHYLKTSKVDINKYNSISQELTVIGTSSSVLTLPEGATNFIIFHQTDDAKLYFGDSSVTTTDYPYLEKNDSISLALIYSPEIYCISDTAGVNVFVVSEVRE